jgi:iron only hydrogenase large subunit-like protein
VEKNKNDILQLEKALKNKKIKLIALLAPSFVAEFDYPDIIYSLRSLGFDKVVELTFGAKLVNREYHKILENPKNKDKMFISSVCPGIVEIVKQKYPQYVKNLMPVDSPMVATAKVCKKFYPKHKTVFISPCNYKKIESQASKYLDYVIDNRQLNELLNKSNIKIDESKKQTWDRFYNDYTKIYPLSGGLSKTAHVKGILHPNQTVVIDGISELTKFLDNPKKEIRFIDTCFCIGGCIGGPCVSNKNSLAERKERLMHYLEVAKHEKIPEQKKGLLEKARDINFSKKY